MNFKLVLFLMACIIAFTFANYAEDQSADFAGAEDQFEAEVMGQLDATNPANVAASHPVSAGIGKPSKKDALKGVPLKQALIMDDYIRFGAEAAKGKRDIKTMSLEPPAAVLPPVNEDVDQNILNMAYDLSFHPRPNAGQKKQKLVKRGAKILNAVNKMLTELEWAVRDGKPAKKVAKKGKKAATKKGKKAAAAPKK